jgi:uncharacterized protein with FMN-binding domain
MRRAVLTFVATVAGLVLLLSYKSHGNATLLRPGAFATPGRHDAAGAHPHATSTPRASASKRSTSSRTAHTPTKATARTVTGQVADTPYGPVQLELTATGGHITDVRPLQLPQGSGRDIQIDNYAVPQLIQETLAAQSAQIDMVSGATYTSQGYLESLQSAIDLLSS